MNHQSDAPEASQGVGGGFGGRGLLIALSGIYWFWAVLHAIAFGITAQRRTLHSRYNELFLDPGADHRPLFKIATERGLEAVGAVLALYAVGFLLLAAICAAAMWISHGLRKAP